MSKFEEMQIILDSYHNGQGRQMVEQIDEYGTYDFWADLQSSGLMTSLDIVELTIKYMRISNR